MSNPAPSHHGIDVTSHMRQLSPAFRGGQMQKLRDANVGKTNDQIDNNTAAALGYVPPQKARYNQR